MYLLASEMPLFFIVLSWEGKGLWISFHHVNSLYIGSRCLKDNVLPFTILGGIYYIKICIFFFILHSPAVKLRKNVYVKSIKGNPLVAQFTEMFAEFLMKCSF